MMRTDMAQSYLIIWLADGPYILSLEKVTKKKIRLVCKGRRFCIESE
jgi:hypothetical protein